MSKTKDQRAAKSLEKTWDTLNHLLFISSCLYKLNLKSIAQITLSILAMIISTSLIIAAIIFIASANNKVTLTTAIIQDATSQIKNTTPTYLTQNPQLGISFFNLSGTTTQTTAILALTTPSVESILQSTTVKTKNTTTTQIQPSKPTTKQHQNKPPNKPNNDFHFEVFNFVPCSICSNNPTCWAICKRIPSKKPGKKTTTKPTKKPTIKTTKKRSQTSNHKTKGSTYHQAHRKANHQHHQTKHQNYTAHRQYHRKSRTHKSRGNPPFNLLRRQYKPFTSLYNIRVPITTSISIQHNKPVVIKKRIIAKKHD